MDEQIAFTDKLCDIEIIKEKLSCLSLHNY